MSGSATTYPESGVPAADAAPPLPEAVLATVAEGLGHGPDEPKRVIVLGAGIAGLVAAYELTRAGHQPIVLEARGRVGGRIATVRDFAPGLYAEAGAGCVPLAHELTLRYCERFGLRLRPFVMDNPRALLHRDGRSTTLAETARHPERHGGPDRLDPPGRDPDRLDPHNRADRPDPAVDAAGARPWDRAAADLLGASAAELREIEGGADRLAEALFRKVSRLVRFGAEVAAIEQDAETVAVHFTTAAGRFTVHGDHAVCTLPAPALAKLDFTPRLPEPKLRAIAELRYRPATKVLLQVRHRFWEHPKYDIVGGSTETDLPIRRIGYPSHSDPATPRGVLLASYTWGDDALHWAGLDPATRIERAIADVARIHPEIIEEFESGTSYAWPGAFADFDPGRFEALRPLLAAPEGRIHFAGEHCSAHHGWIQGALESGLRAAGAVHRAPVAAAARAGRSG